MRNTSPLCVLIADDHLVVRMGVSALLELESGFKVVGMVENGEKAVAAYRQLRPDVVLMDLRMPVMDGIEATKKILQEFPDARLLMLTTYEAEEEIHRALQAGACGYILKRTSGSELVEAIHTAHSGNKWIPPAVQRQLDQRNQSPQLTARQVEVVGLIVKGYSNKEIAGYLGFTEDGAKAHVRTIFTKMGVSDRSEAVSAAIQRGIIRVD